LILVVGSTGYLGGEICRRLAAAGERVRGLVRSTSDPSAVKQLQDAGIETVVGDLRDRASLDVAVRGVDMVISTATTTRSRQADETIESTDQQGQLNLVEAADEAGVERYIYVSYSGQLGDDDPLTVAKRTVERKVRESGMTYTILRPSFFMEAWLSPVFGFDYSNARATIYGRGESKISWISLGDVAEFAVRAVDDPKAENAVLELGGPEALSPLEVVRIFEEVGGKPCQVQHVSEEALRAQKQAATDSMSRAFAGLMLAYAGGDPIPMADTLREFPVRLRSVREYASEAVTS
jgi:uncharacterized protein YbjT (DUF2867 family)